MNAYLEEDPIKALEGRLENLLTLTKLSRPIRHFTALLHGMFVGGLVCEARLYNTEFGRPPELYSPVPYRSSDHDPVIVGLNFSIEPLIPGDINGDGDVDAVDVQLVINAALDIDIEGLDADVNDDGDVNAVDVQLVINAALA